MQRERDKLNKKEKNRAKLCQSPINKRQLLVKFILRFLYFTGHVNSIYVQNLFIKSRNFELALHVINNKH